MFELIDYISLSFFLLFSILISKIILNLHYYLIPKSNSLDKMLGYECGYDPFEDSRQMFNVQFYLVGILFLIFDLEIAFIFPCAVSLSCIGIFGLFTNYIFLVLLGVGFIFEFKKGALYW